MANARFLFDDKWRTITNLTATSEAGSQVIENTQNPLSSRAWRSTSAVAQTITASRASFDADCLVIAGHNFTDAATVAVTTKLSTVTVTSFNMIINGTDLLVAWPAAAEIDELEIVITDTGNPAGYIQIGQIMIGAKLELEDNFNYGVQFEYRRDISQQRTAGQGLRSSGTGIIKRQVAINLEWLAESGRAALKNALTAFGPAYPCFCSFYPGLGSQAETDYQFIAKPSDFVSAHWAANWNRAQLEFNEV